jgi:hypothetical protein
MDAAPGYLKPPGEQEIARKAVAQGMFWGEALSMLCDRNVHICVAIRWRLK